MALELRPPEPRRTDIRVGHVQEADVIIVGGGITGLLSAIRLAAGGATVALVERALMGSGATGGNHGVIHSGALYAQYHPEIVQLCQQAQALVRNEFPSALVGVLPAVYFGQPDRIGAVVKALTGSGVRWSPSSSARAAQQIRATGTHSVVVEETVISSRRILIDLVLRADALGVQLMSRTGVQSLIRRRDHWLLGLSDGRSLAAGIVVLAAGHGIAPLLTNLAPEHAQSVRSRLEVMVYLPKYRPVGPAFCVDYGGVTIVPTISGALLSLHGAPRIEASDLLDRAVPLARANKIVAAAAVFPGLTDALSGTTTYTCVKTEWTDQHADRWGSRPGYQVIDHASIGLPGLFTVIPGKMTLAFHATQDLATHVLRTRISLELPSMSRRSSTIGAEALVSREPWRTPSKPKEVNVS